MPNLSDHSIPGNTPAGSPTASAVADPPASPEAVFDGRAHRHPIGSEAEIRVSAGTDERGARFVELRLYRRDVSELSHDESAFLPTDAGLRIPAHRAALIGAQLQGLGIWADHMDGRS